MSVQVWEVQPSVLIFREVRTSAKRVALKVTVPSGCSGTFIATSLCEVKSTMAQHTFAASRVWRWIGEDLPYKQHDEGTVFQIQEEAESDAAWWQHQCALCGHCMKRERQFWWECRDILNKTVWEESVLRGLGVVVRPNPLKLIKVVSTEHGPVSCEVFKVVHDDSNKQVDNLDREKCRRSLEPHKVYTP